MFLSEETLDDLLRTTLETILASGVHIKATKGSNTELSGVLLELRNPRARLSRTETKGTVFSCLGETLWYLARSNRLDVIKYYLSRYGEFSDDGVTVYGAYGPRLFSMRGKTNQIRTILKVLQRKRTTRQAVIQLFNAEDLLRPHKDVPCTCILQFFIRGRRLNMITFMRSNDAFLGLPHDVFAFTFIQELLCRSLKLQLGWYKHAVGSLHLYDRDKRKAKRYLKEGWQKRAVVMPSMPPGDPWNSLSKLLVCERRLRCHLPLPASKPVSNYWLDLVRLLQIFANSTNSVLVSSLKQQMSTGVYNTYIDKRLYATRANLR